MKSNPEEQRQYFNQENSQYCSEKILNPERHVEAEITELLKIVKQNASPELTIDFGAGTGRLTIPLLKAGVPVLAIDISEASLQRLHNLAQQQNVHSLLETATDLPKNRKVSLIVGSDVLHHVDITKTLAQLSIVLSEDGRCIFSEPNFLNLTWCLFITFSKSTSWRLERGIIFCHYFAIKRYFESAGYNLKIHGFGLLPPHLLAWSKRLTTLNYYLGRLPLFKVFAFRLLIEATKRPSANGSNWYGAVYL